MDGSGDNDVAGVVDGAGVALPVVPVVPVVPMVPVVALARRD